MKTLTYTPQALKDMRSIPTSVAQRIRAKLQQVAADPTSQGNNLKRLQGQPAFRLRIGDYRAIFLDDGTVITVTKVGPRGSVYE